MKKVLPAVIALLLALCLLIPSLVRLAAQDDMTLALSRATVRAGETATLSLSLSHNAGTAALYVRLSYDPAVLTLSSVRDQTLLEDFAYYDAGGEVVLSWEPATYDNTADGILALLDFTIAAGAPEGEAAVTLTPYENGILNKNTDVLSCALESGAVSVLSADRLRSDTLSIDQNELLVGSILPGTTVEQIKGAFDTIVTVEKAGLVQGSEALAATGMTVRSGAFVYTLVVTGDADGNGLCDEDDLDVIRRHLLAQGSPEGAFFTAADVSGDGRVTITDFLLLKSVLAGKAALSPRAV